MRQVKKPYVIVFCLGLLTSPASWSAVPVVTVPGSTTVDYINLFQTTATAFQTLDILRRVIRDMQPLTTFAVNTLQLDVEEIQQLLDQICAVMGFSPAEVQAIFDELYPDDIETICTPDTRLAWIQRAMQQTRLANRDAVKAQALVASLRRTMARVLMVVNQLMDIGGNVEGIQTVSQHGSLMILEQARLTSMLSVFTRATSSREAFDVTDQRAIACIHERSMVSSPRSVPFALGGGVR